MATVLYLAMKEEEFVPLMSPSVKTGWLDCCFSRSDPGLDCLPSSLPSGSLLILTDRLPFRDHDPVLIAQQLSQTVTALDCAAVLLDFEQPSVPELAKLAMHLTSTLPCSVAVSDLYAKNMDCPVFLPPSPHHIPLAEYIRPWTGREIWLDLARNAETLTVTSSGSSAESAPWFDAPRLEHTDQNLHCHYCIQTTDTSVRFLLRRTNEDMIAILQDAEALGIRNCVALYQEWKEK